MIKHIVTPADFHITVSNIGVVNDFSSLYTTNSGSYTATIQTQLTEDHKTGSYEYMARVQRAINEQFPELRTFIQSGSMVDAILNTGMPAPIDIQVTSPDLAEDHRSLRRFRKRSPPFPESARFTFRRTWITRDCVWISIACTPPNWV